MMLLKNPFGKRCKPLYRVMEKASVGKTKEICSVSVVHSITSRYCHTHRESVRVCLLRKDVKWTHPHVLITE